MNENRIIEQLEQIEKLQGQIHYELTRIGNGIGFLTWVVIATVTYVVFFK